MERKGKKEKKRKCERKKKRKENQGKKKVHELSLEKRGKSIATELEFRLFQFDKFLFSLLLFGERKKKKKNFLE